METELKDLKKSENDHNYHPQLPLNAIDDGDGGQRPLLKSHFHEQSRSPDSSPCSPSAAAVTVTAAELEEMEKSYAAYVRHDVYGPLGRGPVPLTEKLLLGLAMVTLFPVRIVLAMIVLVLYYVICRVCTLFSAPNREGEQQEDYAHLIGWRRRVIVRCGRILSRLMLFVFGFYWIRETCRDPYNNRNIDRLMKQQAENKEQSKEPERPAVIVSNHISYLDILYHMSSSFPSFVAKREYKSSDFQGVSGIVTERVKEAHENEEAPLMMLFPEGTTTNGDFLLPFKTGAFLASLPVLPVILRFPYQRFSPAWDSMAGARHVILLLCQFANYMEVTRLPVYCPSKEEKDDPKLYANNIRRLMASEGNLVLSDIGLAEKRVYHAALNAETTCTVKERTSSVFTPEEPSLSAKALWDKGLCLDKLLKECEVGNLAGRL
ncbi:hypothetical protein V2J09_011733 [Rumex salicifolius]